ncbi:MAG: histidine kinase [Prolixibacteraceae bacterium]
MKTILITIIALFSIAIVRAQKPIVISGKIENCQNRNPSFLEKKWFNPETLVEETKTIDFSIAENGQFYLKIIPSNSLYNRYWIQLGYERTHLDLTAGDSIYMTLDATWFDETIKYYGKGSGRNNYRRGVFLEFWDNPDKLNFANNSTQFLNGLKMQYERKMSLLNRYYLSGEIDSSYYRLEREMLNYEKFSKIITKYPNPNQLPDSITGGIELLLKTTDFGSIQRLQYNEYKELVKKLPEYINQQRVNKAESQLKQVIEIAESHYSGMVLLFFKSELLKKYFNQANSLSQKKALLSFFSNQYKEPTLVKKINELNRQIHNDSVFNQEIFQASLIICLWVGLLSLALFLIIKFLPKINNKKINIAQWLKIGFYLIAFVVSITYLGQGQFSFESIILVILLVGEFLFHTYRSIPRFAFQRKYLHYSVSILLPFIVFVVCLLLNATGVLPYGKISIAFLLYFLIIVLSWISHYINQLATSDSSLKSLIKSGELNLEIGIHVIVLFIANFVFIASNNGQPSLNSVLLFYSIISILYFNIFVAFPRFFKKEKIAQFIRLQIMILAGSFFVSIVMEAIQTLVAFRHIGLKTGLFDLIGISSSSTAILLLFMLLLIPSFSYYYIKGQLKHNESTGFKLYRQKEAELAQLRSQVNPHFLFNTLNTLYAFALKEGSDKTAECIAKLANLMRFMLDDMKKEMILLDREVSYIQDYIKLQSIRSAVEQDITISIDIDPEKGYSIAPMLLIPFVENAFKHGLNPNKISQLRIDITAKDNTIQFVIENSLDNEFEAYYKERGFGIGIENVKSRLEHIYPQRHMISIAKTKDKFIVIISISGF